MTIRVTFSLDEISDADLLRWLDAQHNRSEAIRDALRAGRHPGQGEGRALDEQQIRRILREELANVTIAANGDAVGEDKSVEDPALAAALDKMF